MRLGDGTWASWLAMSDEASGAILYTVAFPTRYWTQVEATEIRAHLQHAFGDWGLPQTLRFDNGRPWGTSSAVPSDMSLWLVGLGLGLAFGRPARSTDNAGIERVHGVLNGWVEPGQCVDLAHLQQQLAEFSDLQRARYPLADKQPRLQRYPELLTNSRAYAPHLDRARWSLQRVYDYLATFRFQRRVAVNGRVALLNRDYSMGRASAGRTVAIQMDPVAHQWVVYDDYGRVLKQFQPKDLTYSTFFNMTLAQRRRK